MRWPNGLGLFGRDDVSDGVPVLAHTFANVVHLIGKGDLQGVEGVLRVLHQLCLRRRHLEELFLAHHAGFFVVLEHEFSHFFVVRSHDEKVLVSEILQTPSFH